MAKMKDFVCGMDVDTETAAAKTEYQGKTYYFCAQGCKIAFEKDPGKYLQGAHGQHEGHQKHCCCC